MTNKFLKEVIFNKENICLAEKRPLIRGLNLTRWCFESGNVFFEKDCCNTLSLSLEGSYSACQGYNNPYQRNPNSISIIPKDVTTYWHVNSKIKFAHFYIESKVLTEFASINYGMDVRGLLLKNSNCLNDETLLTLMKKCLEPDLTSVGYEQLSYLLLNHILMNYSGCSLNHNELIGGLSPHQRIRIIEFIHDNISNKITIDELSKEVCLSPFHFAREFKHSFSIPPAQYILRRRLYKVKEMLKTTLSLADISVTCGFNTQSHMTMYFKKLFNITPAEYRKLL
ncbi:helix-turn-helix transcriptional regulator [Shewanella zhangzhouensis]|uniref:helix-turn-helix transcriptional regulator n=1 Tax=Shewanella zhangzhouensis TaxID=2864213 RepID=UPI001C660FFE|nr:AraC family transcriptional regulator [Shewanella zhangzhouensis]QYK05844.1 AraC family transcriptional regulator [Shewanella zhangzhouensis]